MDVGDGFGRSGVVVAMDNAADADKAFCSLSITPTIITAPTPNPLTFRWVHSRTPNDYTLNQMAMFEQETSMLADARKADTNGKGLSKRFHVSHAAGLYVVSETSHPSPSLSASDPSSFTLWAAKVRTDSLNLADIYNIIY
ncbi:hypothetical protein PQX77_014545 [Marasmius sp. AFHP31]|nr:hypothetical protein PQX77_014545 [Marasmius sp. AFHP31]